MKNLNFYFLIFYSFVLIGLFQSGCKKEEKEPENQFPRTTEEIQISIESIIKINAVAEQIIEQKINNALANDDVIIPQVIANEILSIENVVSATPSSTGSSINIKQKDGVTFNVLIINPNDSRVFKQISKTHNSLLKNNGFISNQTINKSFPNGSGKAIIIAPFEEEFNTDIEYIQNKLTTAGFTNQTYYKQDNLDIFKGDFLREFDVIIFSTHGGAFVQNRTGISSTALCTGVQATAESLSTLTKAEQEAVGFMMVNGKLYYGINVSWLQLTTTGDFVNSWIYANSCESSKIDVGSESLSEAFFSLGAGGYNGYDEIIYTNLAGKILKKMLHNFCSGSSLEVAANETRNDTELKIFAWFVRLANNPDLYATVDLLDNHQREIEPYFLKENNGFETGTVTDYDGNVYNTIKIGDQWWMAENLKVKHYSDGTPIQNGEGLNYSVFDEVQLWYYYNDDENNMDEYGLLYNWYAATRRGNSQASNTNPSGIQGVAPEGWHIPSDAEWMELEASLGYDESTHIPNGGIGYIINDLGHILKEPNNNYWNNIPANTPYCGFDAIPSGRRVRTVLYEGLGSYGEFWTTTNRYDNIYYGCSRSINSTDRYFASQNTAQWDKTMGLSIRCVKDAD